ncbi:MAG: outer rane efflux protein [Firmicutes bacterium]|nr:outer rane efflux protein [Bacillota bacterium]
MKSRLNYWKTALLPVIASVTFWQSALAMPMELSLDESIALTFKNNPALQIVEARNEQSVWALKEAQTNKAVSIDFTHTDLRSTSPPTWVSSLSAISPYNYFSNQITASIPLYTGGKLEHVIKQAKLSHDVSQLEVTATKQQLKLETSMGYYNVLQGQTLLEIAKQTVNDFSAHLNRVRQMYDTGVVPWHDVLQTKVRLANAENNLVKAQNAYDLAIYSLNKSMGLPLRSEIALTEPLIYQEYTLTFDDVSAYGLAHRPEMVQQQANIKREQAQIKIAQSGQRPQVTMTGTMAWDDNDFAGIDNRDWTAMLVTQFNILDSGNTQAKIKQAQAGELAARKQAQQTQENISLEISDAYLSMKEAEKRISTNKVAVEEASVNFDIAQKAYSAGVGTNLDVMDAELALNQAKTNYTNSLFDYNISKAQLDKAIGSE